MLDLGIVRGMSKLAAFECGCLIIAGQWAPCHPEHRMAKTAKSVRKKKVPPLSPEAEQLKVTVRSRHASGTARDHGEVRNIRETGRYRRVFAEVPGMQADDPVGAGLLCDL